MTSLLERVEEELLEARRKVREGRRDLTGGRLEDAALEAGAATWEAIDGFFEAVDEHLALASMALHQYGSQMASEGEDLLEAIAEDLREARVDLRTALEGGEGAGQGRGPPDEAVASGDPRALEELELRLDGIIDRLRTWGGGG